MTLDELRESEELAAKGIVNLCNSMSTEFGDALAKELQCTHRTIQQSAVRELLKAITSLAGTHSDLRNEASVTAASKIKELNLYFPFV